MVNCYPDPDTPSYDCWEESCDEFVSHIENHLNRWDGVIVEWKPCFSEEDPKARCLVLVLDFPFQGQMHRVEYTVQAGAVRVQNDNCSAFRVFTMQMVADIRRKLSGERDVTRIHKLIEDYGSQVYDIFVSDMVDTRSFALDFIPKKEIDELPLRATFCERFEDWQDKSDEQFKIYLHKLELALEALNK